MLAVELVLGLEHTDVGLDEVLVVLALVAGELLGHVEGDGAGVDGVVLHLDGRGDTADFQVPLGAF